MIAIAEVVLCVGVEQLKQSDVANEDPRLIVARIYAAMEMAAMALEEEFSAQLHGVSAPMDKSKLN